MPVPEGKVPIVRSAGEAVRFVFEQWRAALVVGVAAGLMQSATMLALGPNVPGMLALGLIAAMAHAALLRRAIGGAEVERTRLAFDGLRVFAAMAVVGLMLFMLAFAVTYGAMAVLIPPYAEEAKAIGENREQMQALLERAVVAQPHVLYWALAIGGVAALLLTSRLYVAAPATVDRRRITVFESWRLTRGNMLRVTAARMLALAPAAILVAALQSIVGFGFGLSVGNMAALAVQAQGDPIRFALFYGLAGALQVALFGAMEAGLAAYLYKGLKPPAEEVQT